MITRLSILGITNAPTELAAFIDAYTKMQALKPDNPSGWITGAGIHGISGDYCWHGEKEVAGQPYRLFLPWHRAFLLDWEHRMRQQNPAAALPWWDWTAGKPKELPTIFTDHKNASLCSGPFPVATINGEALPERTERNPNTFALPRKSDVDALLEIEDFLTFQDELEDLHGSIHVWVGGSMGLVPTAAYDPIFWSHHCMIDQIWHRWQLLHGNSTIPEDQLNLGLPPFTNTVKSVLDIRRLGYDYAASAVTVMAAAPDTPVNKVRSGRNR